MAYGYGPEQTKPNREGVPCDICTVPLTQAEASSSLPGFPRCTKHRRWNPREGYTSGK